MLKPGLKAGLPEPPRACRRSQPSDCWPPAPVGRRPADGVRRSGNRRDFRISPQTPVFGPPRLGGKPRGQPPASPGLRALRYQTVRPERTPDIATRLKIVDQNCPPGRSAAARTRFRPTNRGGLGFRHGLSRRDRRPGRRSGFSRPDSFKIPECGIEKPDFTPAVLARPRALTPDRSRRTGVISRRPGADVSGNRYRRITFPSPPGRPSRRLRLGRTKPSGRRPARPGLDRRRLDIWALRLWAVSQGRRKPGRPPGFPAHFLGKRPLPGAGPSSFRRRRKKNPPRIRRKASD